MAKRHGPAYWREHIQNWVRSDLTQREYCANNGLSEASVPSLAQSGEADHRGGKVIADPGAGERGQGGNG
ncbi:MAG: hypothetical protein IPL03_16290 [Sterolibacteriaceae bacterium]|nr:hypothetical protein [Candidatus Methylophosphatis haderslevensis]